MTSSFDGQVLAEKLSKLNNSQQSIEKLSHWCILHRKKAKRVVETWDKLYNSSLREQRLSFLYLANDIIQNSRRKGSEFVNEFWKVLPTALKDVSENGDDNGKKAVSRLVDIWEERKVFGSRGRTLKEEILARDLPPAVENNVKSSNSIKKVKKDAPSIRIKLALGSMPEQIVSAFQLVLDEHFSEDTALNNCEAAVRRVGTMEKHFDNACAQDNQQLSTFGNELQEQENLLQQCIQKLESAETARVALVTQLKEALLDQEDISSQESKLELIRGQLKVGRAQFEQASKMRQKFSSNPVSAPTPPITINLQSEVSVTESGPPPPIRTLSTNPETPESQPVTSFATSVTDREEENKRVTAAAVAAKLAASTSSLQMLSSVFSSLVAEEAASKNVGQKTSRFAPGSPIFSPEKRPKHEKPMPGPDMGSMTYFGHQQEQQGLSAVTSAPSSQASPTTTGMHPMFQAPYLVRPPFTPPPPPPPQPLHQYRQPGIGMPPLPPPPLPTHMGTGLPIANNSPQQRPLQQQQQQPTSQGYYQQPMGNAFYGQNHQPAPPPVPPQ